MVDFRMVDYVVDCRSCRLTTLGQFLGCKMIDYVVHSSWGNFFTSLLVLICDTSCIPGLASRSKKAPFFRLVASKIFQSIKDSSVCLSSAPLIPLNIMYALRSKLIDSDLSRFEYI